MLQRGLGLFAINDHSLVQISDNTIAMAETISAISAHFSSLIRFLIRFLMVGEVLCLQHRANHRMAASE